MNYIKILVLAFLNSEKLGKLLLTEYEKCLTSARNFSSRCHHNSGNERSFLSYSHRLPAL